MYGRRHTCNVSLQNLCDNSGMKISELQHAEIAIHVAEDWGMEKDPSDTSPMRMVRQQRTRELMSHTHAYLWELSGLNTPPQTCLQVPLQSLSIAAGNTQEAATVVQRQHTSDADACCRPLPSTARAVPKIG